MENSNTDMMGIVEDILDFDPQMRFVAIIDLAGNILESIMKNGKNSLKSQRNEEHFCKQVAQRRNMRGEFNGSLGTVKYIHVEREWVSQFVVYTDMHTIYFTMEPELSIEDKLYIIAKVKKITEHM